MCVGLIIIIMSHNYSPEPYLLFSTWFTVSRMNLDGSGYTELVSGSVGAQAVDYHLG